MSAFELVTLVVCVVALAVAVATWLRAAPMAHGRHGRNWFDHREDIAAEDQPSEDDRDAPIPKRPLRGRPDI